jgi:hypothetical protein
MTAGETPTVVLYYNIVKKAESKTTIQGQNKAQDYPDLH